MSLLLPIRIKSEKEGENNNNNNNNHFPIPAQLRFCKNLDLAILLAGPPINRIFVTGINTNSYVQNLLHQVHKALVLCVCVLWQIHGSHSTGVIRPDCLHPSFGSPWIR
jgi:hypothetical protein